MFLVAVCVGASACGGTKPVDEFGMKDQAQIRERAQTFVKAFNDKNVPQILGVYAENSVFMPPNQPVIRGKDALKMFYDEMFTGGAGNLRLTLGEISGHGPLAYASGSYEMEVKPSTGPTTRDRGKLLFVLRRMNDTWRYEYTVWNSDLPQSGN